MKTLNSPYLTLALLALFIWLAIHAWHAHPQRSAFNQFVDQQEAAYHPKDAGVAYRSHERTVLVWSNKKAALLAEAQNLTPDSVDADLP